MIVFMKLKNRSLKVMRKVKHIIRLEMGMTLSLSFFLLLLLCSCQKTEKNVEGFCIKVDIGESVNTPFRMSQFVDSICYLQIDSTYIVGHISEMKMVDDCFYICDKHEGALYKVDKEGKVLLRLANKGRAKDEYYNMTDVDIDPHNGDIHVWDAVSHRFIVYSNNGSFIKDVPNNEVVRDFAVTNNGGYLIYTPDYNGQARRGLWLIDSNGTFKKQLVEIDEDFKYGGIYPRYLVSLGKNSVGLMGGEDRDYIYEVKDDSAIVRYHLDFGYSIPKELAERTLLNFENYKGKIYTKNSYLENKRWLLFCSSNIEQTSMSIYDKKENKHYQISKPEDIVQDVGLYGEALYMNDSIYICVVEPNNFPNKEELKKIPIAIGNNSNPLFVIGKIKQ